MFRKFLATAAVAALALPTVAAAEAGDDTIYLRVNEAEACADFELYLSVDAGGDEGACGYIGGIPFDNVFGEPSTYTLEKGTALRISGEAADGQITVNHGQGAAGGGSYAIELTLYINGSVAGSTTASGNTGGMGSSTIDFTMDIDPAFAGKTVTSMSLDVLMGGVFLNSGYLAAGDQSFFNLPRA